MNAGIFWLLLAIFGMLWVIAAGLGHEATKREGPYRTTDEKHLGVALAIAGVLIAIGVFAGLH